MKGYMILYKDSGKFVQFSAMYGVVFGEKWEAEQEKETHHDKDNMKVIKVNIEVG